MFLFCISFTYTATPSFNGHNLYTPYNPYTPPIQPLTHQAITYITYITYITSHHITSQFSLESSWGILPLGKFEGDSAVISERPLTIQFRNSAFCYGSIRLSLEKQDYKSYTFSYVSKNFAVARSSLGSVTLLRKGE